MELKGIITITTVGRVPTFPTFNLHISPCKSYFLCSREKHFEVLQARYKRQVPTKTSAISRCVQEYPLDWPTELLEKKRESIFSSIKQHNHVEAVFNAKWDPSIYTEKPKVRLVKAEFSPRSNGQLLLAILMNNGAFHLYREVKREWTSCCNVAEKYIEELAKEKITSYTGFKETLGCTEIVSFEWMPSAGETFQMICATKNGSLVLVRFNAEERDFKFFQQKDTIENLQQIKIIQKGSDCLMVSTSVEGELALYKLQQRKGVLNLKKVTDLWPEKDWMTVNCISVAENGDSMRIFAVKGFHLLIFQLKKNLELEDTIVQQFPCPFITGLHVIDYSQIIISLANQKIYFGVIMDGKLQLIEINNEYDRNYSCSGIIGCENKGIYFLSFTASKAFDPAILKTPEKLILSTFSKFNPFKIVLEDPRRTISNHFEYFEIVRYQNKPMTSENNQLMELISKAPKEDMEQVKYYLKMQMFLLHGPLCDNLTREITEEIVEKENFIKSMIRAMGFHQNLAIIVSRSNLTNDQLMVNRNLRTALTEFLNSSNRYGYSALVERMKENFMAVIEKSKGIGKDLKNDQCYLCDEDIVHGRLTCVHLHAVNRCCYTNMQISILATPHCRICGAQALDKDEIKNNLGTELAQSMCPFCDVEIE